MSTGVDKIKIWKLIDSKNIVLTKTIDLSKGITTDSCYSNNDNYHATLTSDGKYIISCNIHSIDIYQLQSEKKIQMLSTFNDKKWFMYNANKQIQVSKNMKILASSIR